MPALREPIPSTTWVQPCLSIAALTCDHPRLAQKCERAFGLRRVRWRLRRAFCALVQGRRVHRRGTIVVWQAPNEAFHPAIQFVSKLDQLVEVCAIAPYALEIARVERREARRRPRLGSLSPGVFWQSNCCIRGCSCQLLLLLLLLP